MSSLRVRSARVLRTLARANPRARRVIGKVYHRPTVVVGDSYVHRTGRNHTIVSEKRDPDSRRIGIYLRGACDLPAVFGVGPLLRDGIRGTAAVWRDPIQISGSRSDLMLQSLEPVDPASLAAREEVMRRLQLRKDYFAPRVFESSFTIPHEEQAGPFPKSVVVFSTAPDFSRTLYRHREHGFLVDPGGFWLSSTIESAMADPETVAWFAKSFKSVGRLPVDRFQTSFGALVSEVIARTGAHVLVFNMLTIDPLEQTHNYSMIKQPDTARRRAFTIALSELSRELDFDVVDVDRILKLGGVQGQVDFAHFSEAQFAPIAAEAFRILREREIV